MKVASKYLRHAGFEHHREEVLRARGGAEHLLRFRIAARADQRHQRDARHPQDRRLRLAPRVQGQVVITGTPP